MNPQSCVVLMYHVIDQPRSAVEAPYCCPPELFEDHLRYLVEQGYSPIGLPRLLDCLDGVAAWPLRPVVITIDDGVECAYRNALPLLAARKLPATVFMIADLVDGYNDWVIPEGFPRRAMLKRSELIALDREGIEIGSHTRTHPRLGRVPVETITGEVRDSKSRLEDILQKPVQSFAYPYGSLNRAARDAVQAAGYRSGCSTIQGRNRPRTDRFVLRRVSINGEDSLPRFRTKLWLGMSAATCVRATAREALARMHLMPPKSHA